MKKIFILIIGIFISVGAIASDWECLSVELNDTTLTYQADSMILRGGVVFQWHDGSPETDTIIMWLGCVDWKTINDLVCVDCYGCNGKTLRVKLYESYDAWLERQKLVINCWVGCHGPQPTITLSTDTSEFGNVVIGSGSMKMYYVSGSRLPLSNIEINTPPGFQVSTNSASGWSSSMTLTDSVGTGTISDTIIYILFSPTSETYYSGAISNKSCGTEYNYVTVSGTGYLSPLPECCELNYPEQNSSEIPVDTEFSWQASENALGYFIVIATEEYQLMELPLIDVGNNTEWTPTTPLQYNTTYYWRVTPYNDDGVTEWCPIWEFNTQLEETLPPIITHMLTPNGTDWYHLPITVIDFKDVGIFTLKLLFDASVIDYQLLEVNDAFKEPNEEATYEVTVDEFNNGVLQFNWMTEYEENILTLPEDDMLFIFHFKLLPTTKTFTEFRWLTWIPYHCRYGSYQGQTVYESIFENLIWNLPEPPPQNNPPEIKDQELKILEKIEKENSKNKNKNKK